MSSLGDLRWLNRYVGTRYRWGGRDLDNGLDCYGLVKLIKAERDGQDLPDWQMAEIDIRGRAEAIEIAIEAGTWTETDDPADGDFVVCYRERCAHHMGLYYGGGVIHCTDTDDLGVIYEPIARFAEQYAHIVFGGWEP